jgi:shikimate kinase
MLSDKLGMYYADMQDMFEYELIDTKHIMATLGEEEGQKFIQETEHRVINNVSKFDNTLINIRPDKLFDGDNYQSISKHSYIIYVQISPKFFDKRTRKSGDIIPERLKGAIFAEKDKCYVHKSDIVVNCSTLKESKATKKIMSEITKFFRKNIKIGGN